MRIVTTLALLGAMALPVAASAQNWRNDDSRSWSEEFDVRLNRIDRRIDRGANNGELTRREVRQLETERDRLVYAARQARADGIVTYRERQALDDRTDRLERQVRVEMADTQEQPRPWANGVDLPWRR